jgi:hypothetical protein
VAWLMVDSTAGVSTMQSRFASTHSKLGLTPMSNIPWYVHAARKKKLYVSLLITINHTTTINQP